MNDLSCGGFADGAGDCDDLEIAIFTIPGGEVAEGFYCVGYFKNRFTGKFIGGNIFTDDGAGCAFCEGIG